MSDSQRLSERVDKVVRRRGVPRPFSLAEVEAITARHVNDPSRLLDAAADPDAVDRSIEEIDRRFHRDRIQRKADILLNRLPVRYRDATLPGDASGAAAHEWLAGYRAGNRNPLVILGTTGSGKTWLACALARELLTRDVVPTLMTTTPDFLAALRPSSGVDTDMLTYSLVPVLVLDDLGTEQLTDWGIEQLYRLAHERSHNGRPTIVTSNLSGADIRARYGDRVTERMFGGASLITLAGESRRPLPPGF
jgi:DNA replication protein DnaC